VWIKNHFFLVTFFSNSSSCAKRFRLHFGGRETARARFTQNEREREKEKEKERPRALDEQKEALSVHSLMSAGEEEEDVYPFQGFDGSNEPIGPCDKFWERVLTKRLEDKKLWYHQGVEYWNTVDATIDGVLGGFGSVSRADAKENEGILRTLVFPEFDFGEMDGGGGGCANKIEKRALDVGAGVGRVSVRDFILFAIHFLLFLFFFFFLCVCMSSRLTFSFSRDRVLHRARS
jgi:hypothetical protein